MADKRKLEAALKRLRADRESVPWPERLELAASLADALAAGRKSDAVLALAHLLADDPKPEVRKEVAELLCFLPEGEFAKLAARLSGDASFFVQKAVQRAMDRRRKGARSAQRVRRTLDQVQAQLATIEKYHGKLAADRARKLADEQFSILVGQTVHDMRGILSPLRSSISTLLADIDGGRPDLKACRENILKMGERLDYLERFVNDMREYSNTAPAKRHRESIADVVEQARTLALDNLTARGFNTGAIEWRVDVQEGLRAEITRHQIVMALNHLMGNAIESFEVVRDRTRPRRIDVRAQMLDGENLELSVRDNGPGIHEDDLREYLRFDAGRTTRKSYGTGFGLPTAHRCAQAHGGTLVIASKLGEGTTVTIVIPPEAEDEEA